MAFKIQSGFSGSRAIVLPRSIISDMEKDIFCQSLIVTDIGYYPQAKFHYVKRDNPIDQFVLLYCISGSGWVSVNGSTMTLSENQIVILPAGVPHSYGSSAEAPWTIYWIHFKGDKAPFFAEGFETPFSVNISANSRIADRLDIFEELYKTLELGYTLDNLRYSTVCLYYFLGSLTYISKYRESSLLTAKGSDDAITQSIHFMKENIHRSLTLADISGYILYSPSYFTTIFRKKTGYSPMNYFTRIKVQKACEYLDTTDMKINQISQLLGYDDQFYFSRIFSKIMGVSPSAFKTREK